MVEHDDEAPGLDAREQMAIAALLTHPTVKAAAEACGIHERTLRHWLADKPEFRSAFRSELKAIMSHVSGRVQQATTLAVSTLEGVMRSKVAAHAAKVSAARAVLEHASRAVEQAEIIERLDALERNASAKDSKGGSS